LRVSCLALAAREETGGRFDPTVHGALVAAGYASSFERLAPDGPARERQSVRCGGTVDVDTDKRTIVLEEGVALDLGGIAKGDAVDRAAAILSQAGPSLVNAGGDIAASKRSDGAPWSVGIETGDGMLTVGLCEGGMATSGRDRRRWRRGAEELHHIIDPRTGRSADTDLLRVTAVRESAVAAEVSAKVLLLAGERGAQAEAERASIPCVLVTEDRRAVLAGGLS
jgi:thiamine biosynthesis lipoprotein